MIDTKNQYRRVKRDGRNPSTGAKTLDEIIIETEAKMKKINNNEE